MSVVNSRQRSTSVAFRAKRPGAAGPRRRHCREEKSNGLLFRHADDYRDSLRGAMSESSQQPEQAATRKEPAPERKARKEGGWTPKDYVTLTLSILAFIVSASTVYFNILRVEENVSVAVDFREFALIRPGGADSPPDQRNLWVSSEHETPIVFVNSGNKSAAVMSAHFIYIQTKEGDPRKCRPQRGLGIDAQTLFKTDLDPLALGPNDVIVKQVKI